MYADGFFETMRCIHSDIPLWGYHQRRILHSAKVLNITIDTDSLLLAVEQAKVCMPQDSVIKLIVGREPSDRASYVVDGQSAVFYANVRPFHSRSYCQTGVRLIGSEYALASCGPFDGLKLINRLNYSVASAHQRLSDGEELLFCNTSGNIVETMHHNIFAFQGDSIITPSLSLAGVKGTMRQYLIDHAEDLFDNDVQERELTLTELCESDAVFICNAVDGVVPVNSINTCFFDNSDGIIRLQSKLQQRWAHA